MTTLAILINALALLVSILKLTQETRLANALRQKEDKRTEYKLRIYHSLLKKELDVNGIIQDFISQNPKDSNVDQIEIRKCIYEMIVEETILSYENGKYTSNTDEK